jgi:hypothetical protein
VTEDESKMQRIEVTEETQSVEPAEQAEITASTKETNSSQPESCKFEVPKKTYTPLKKVYMWAASGVSESISSNESDKFYETPVYKSLRFKLKNTESSLSLVIGLQGTGKSRILRQLNNEGTYWFKWSKNWKEELWQRGCAQSAYWDILAYEYEDQVHAYLKAGQSQRANKVGDPRTIMDRKETSLMEAFLGKSKCNELKDHAISSFIYSTKIILIDMPDYSRSNANALVHDIAEIQRFWESMDHRGNTHLVIAIQKELVLKAPNFFWGKCDKYTVEPLTTPQLIEAYKLSNPDGEVFEPAALQLLAELSRGIFRRFKKYMRLTIETDYQKLPITKDIVERAVTDDTVFQDTDQELADLFDDEEKRRCASRILGYLRSHNEVNVKTIAEDIGISETMAQKIVQKLALYNYIQTKRGDGKEKLVSLQL